MNLRERIFILLFLMFCGYAGIELITYYRVIQPGMEELEQTMGRIQIERCYQSLLNEAGKLQSQVKRLSEDESFKKGGFASLSGAALTACMESSDILCLTNSAGDSLLFGQRQGLPQKVEPAAFITSLLEFKKPLIYGDNIQGHAKKGIIKTSIGPAIVGVSPCRIKTDTNTVSATLLAVRFMAPPLLKELKERLLIPFDWTGYDEKINVPGGSQKGEMIYGGADLYSCQLSDNLLQMHKIISDMDGQPAAVIRCTMQREVYGHSRRMLYLVGLVKLATASMAILVITLIFQAAVLRPIRSLIQDIIAIGRGKHVRYSRPASRKDEIGILAMEFDRMLSRLDAAQKKLVEKSFISGMAEVSSGILHNARNALSPLVVGIERLRECTGSISTQRMEQALSELQNKQLDDARKQDLYKFLHLAGSSMNHSIDQVRNSLDDLSKQVCQIEEMLNGQKTFRGAQKPLELAHLEELTREAIDLIPADLRRKVRVVLDKNLKRLRPIYVQRILFLQVLENLLINAAESIRRAEPLYPKITVSAFVEVVDEIEMLHIEIEDNGAGIDEAMMPRLFERGVSSKSKGLTGIGLHWCANTMTAMKGRVWAHSDGKNKGATFHILLPVSQEKELLITSSSGVENEP